MCAFRDSFFERICFADYDAINGRAHVRLCMSCCCVCAMTTHLMVASCIASCSQTCGNGWAEQRSRKAHKHTLIAHCFQNGSSHHIVIIARTASGNEREKKETRSGFYAAITAQHNHKCACMLRIWRKQLTQYMYMHL